MDDQIAQLITLQVRHAPSTVFGSFLGTQVKRHFPTVDLKVLGGLRRFIHQHCAHEVVWLQKKGGDDMYIHASKLPQGFSVVGEASEPSELSLTVTVPFVENYWRIFTSPNSLRSIFVNTNSGDLKAGTSNTAPPGWRLIPKLTVEEHRSIARQFLSNVDLLDRPELEKIIELQQFWQPWLQMMRFGFGGRYSTAWWNFRSQVIIQLFADRLRAAEVPAALTATVTKQIIESRSDRTQRTTPNRLPAESHRTEIGTPLLPKLVSPAGGSSDLRASELRQLIRLAIESLSEDELRQIKLPLGAVADGFSQRKP